MTSVNEMELQNFDVADFLENYWQKKPLLIKAGLPNTESLISPEELAGLACEEEVESRLITHFNNQWELTHGPIDESLFPTLPDADWTLLVQAVDHWVPEVKSLIDYFHFLPRWRIDDVMVSFASNGGTVSQHYDFYDVFLIQGIGSRKWQVGQICTVDSELLPNKPMKILADFDPQQEWILYPGDILYIPPQWSHYGVALEDCITYSVGFRAPSKAEIMDGVATSLMSSLKEDQRYKDTIDTLKGNPSEISLATVAHVKNMLLECVDDDAVIKHWLGTFATTPKEVGDTWGDGLDKNWIAQVNAGEVIVKDPGSRFAYIVEEHTTRSPEESSTCSPKESSTCSPKESSTGYPKESSTRSPKESSLLYVNGVEYKASQILAEAICDLSEINKTSVKQFEVIHGAVQLIQMLLLSGALIFEESHC